MKYDRKQNQTIHQLFEYANTLSKRKATKDSYSLANRALQDAKRHFNDYLNLKKTNSSFQLRIQCLTMTTELITKSFGLLTNTLSKQDLISHVGHRSPKGMIRLIDGFRIMDLVQMIDKKYSFMEHSFDEFKKKFDKTKNSDVFGRDIITVDKETILKLFKMPEIIEKSLNKKISDKKIKDLVQEKPQHIEQISSILPEITKTKQWKKIQELEANQIINPTGFFMNTFILGLILYPHNNKARYSSLEEVEYTPGLGVIDCIEVLESKTLECLTYLEELIENTEVEQ